MKKNYKYMHTVNGAAAYYDESQICYAGQYVERLCDTLAEIREEQKLSTEWRLKRGFSSSLDKYGYIKVKI